MPLPGWAARILPFLLREDDANALLGDLWEECERRPEARRRCRGELYKSIAAALRLRAVELLRSAPWGT